MKSAKVRFNFEGEDDPAFVAAVAEELDALLAEEALMAELEQIELAQYYATRPPLKAIDGVGPQILAISKTAFIYYKSIEQLDFSSKKDLAWLVNRHPHMKVGGTQTTKTQSGYQAPVRAVAAGILTGPVRNVRETVKYN